MPLIMEGTPPLRGEPYPVFKCGLYVKVNVKINTNALLADAEINTLASPR
jgi:hypothetical protein